MKINRVNVLKSMKSYAAPSKWSIAVLVLISILAIPLAFISPKFFQILIDEVMGNGHIERFPVVLLGIFALYGCRLLMDSVSLYCSNRLLNQFTPSLRTDVWKKYLRIPFRSYAKRDVGDLKMRLMDDVDCLGNFIKEQVVDYVSGLLLIGFGFFMVMRINIAMTFICLGIMPLVFLINHWIGKGSQRINEETRAVNEQYYTFEHNALQFWKEIKSLNAENAFIARFQEFRQSLAKLGLRGIRYWFYSETFSDFKANYLTKVLIYVIGSFFVMKGSLSVGVLIMYGEYFGTLFAALDGINAKNIALKVNTPYYKRVFETLSFDEEDTKHKQEAIITGNITMHNLDFAYIRGQKNVLRDIDLHIGLGEYTAVIGKSGCGKTTLLKLLLGIYPPDKGTILFDDRNIQELSTESLYRQMGVVMQDSTLFNMSIRENLRLSKQNAEEEELIDACRQASIYTFIESLPNGFDTIVGERGVKLSGGQKQRIAIAQALLKKPKLIIFDEATSSLDRLSEDVINQSIHQIAQTTTVLVISHKPATVLRAKRVIVMDEGMIVDSGTHGELIERNAFYQQLAEGA